MELLWENGTGGGAFPARRGEPDRYLALPAQSIPHHVEDLLIHVAGSEHPLKVIRRGRRDLGKGFTPVFAPSEEEFSVSFLEPTVQLSLERRHLITVGVETVQISRKVRIFLDLGRKDGSGGPDVSQGGVCFLMVPAQIETGCGRKVPRFFAVEDHLGIQEATPLDGEWDVGSFELRQKYGNVEATDVEPPQIAGIQKLGQTSGRRRKSRLVGYVLIGDTVDGCGFGWDWNAGVKATDSLHDVPLRGNANDGELDDPVRNRAEACGLHVEEGQGPIQIKRKLHDTPSSVITRALTRQTDPKKQVARDCSGYHGEMGILLKP